MDYEGGYCKECGGTLRYIYCLDEVICEEGCHEDYDE